MKGNVTMFSGFPLVLFRRRRAKRWDYQEYLHTHCRILIHLAYRASPGTKAWIWSMCGENTCLDRDVGKWGTDFKLRIFT